MPRKFLSKLARLMEKYAASEEKAKAKSATQAEAPPQVFKPREEQLTDESMNIEIGPYRGDVEDVDPSVLLEYEKLRESGNLPTGPLDRVLREIEIDLIEKGELDVIPEGGGAPWHEDIKSPGQIKETPRERRQIDIVTTGQKEFGEGPTNRLPPPKQLPPGPEPAQGRPSHRSDVDQVNITQERELRGNLESIAGSPADTPAARAILAENAALADATDDMIGRIIGKALKDKEGRPIKEDPDANFTINQLRREFGENPKKGEQSRFLAGIRRLFGRASGRASETNRRTATPQTFPRTEEEFAAAVRRDEKGISTNLANPNVFGPSVQDVVGPLNAQIAKQQRLSRATKGQRIEDLRAVRSLEEASEGRPVSPVGLTPRQQAIFTAGRESNTGALSKEIMARIRKENPQAVTPEAVSPVGRQSEGSLTGDFETTQSPQNTQNITVRHDLGVKSPLEEGDVRVFGDEEQISTVRSPEDVPTISTGASRTDAELSRIRQIEANQAIGQIDPNVRLRPEQFEQRAKVSKERAELIRLFEEDPQNANSLTKILSGSPVAQGERVGAEELLLRVLKTMAPQAPEPLLLDILKGLRGKTPISSRGAGLRPPELKTNPRPSEADRQAFLSRFRKELNIPEVPGQKGASDKFIGKQDVLLDTIGRGLAAHSPYTSMRRWKTLATPRKEPRRRRGRLP